MPLTTNQLNTVCNLYGGANCCRYLEVDNKTYKYNCLKLNAIRKAKCDKTVTTHVTKEKAKGRNPLQGYEPIYDGGPCTGFIQLTSKMQGLP